MCESTDQTASADGELAHYLATCQDTADAITSKLIERSLTLDDLKPVLTYLGALTECVFQITLLAADAVRDVDTKHLTKNGLKGISVFTSLTFSKNLLKANATFLASIDRELVIAGRALPGASPAESRPEDGPPKAAGGQAFP